MKKRNIAVYILLLISLLFPVSLIAGENESLILAVNKNVAEIEKSIEDEKYSVIILNNVIKQIESVPPEIRLYYEPETLKLAGVVIVAGHESWSKKFEYIYDKDENILKYLEVIDRLDNPPRSAIIYDPKGDVLWKNIEQPEVNPSDIKDFFKKAMFYQNAFSSY